jgi:hypothetical protein
MIYWIKRGGRLFGSTVFFLVLFSILIRHDGIHINSFLTAFIYAFTAGIICWLIGTILSDIVLKGIVTDIGGNDSDNLLDGGILQRLLMIREQITPGGEEMPFVEIKKTEGATKKQQKKKL